MSKAILLEKLTNKEYRDALIAEEINVGLPMQLREMRESRGWKQAEVAKKIGTEQPRITVMEKPGYGNFSLTTLKKLASVFDVGLIVSFVPYSEMIDFRESLTRKRLAIPSYCDEYLAMEKRYQRRSAESQVTSQGVLDFSVGTSAPAAMPSTDTQVVPISTTESTTNSVEVGSIYASCLVAAKGGNTYYVSAF